MRRIALPGFLMVLLLSGCQDTASSAGGPTSAAAPVGPVVIAHRGYSGVAPEHTLVAFDLAVEAEADYLEQDLQMTADGVLVVLHDATLDRTARGPAEHCTGAVIEKTLAQIRRCDYGTWFNERNPDLASAEFEGVSVPALEELFVRYGRSVRYYIETKNPEEAPGMEEALVALLGRYRLLDATPESPPRVLVQSFSPESLRKLHSLEPSLPLVQLYGRMPAGEIVPQLPGVASYAVGIGPHFSSVDEELVAAAQRAGLVVHPYTVNDPAEMSRLFAIGVDGFFTDQTTRARAVRRSMP
jgi:glycerophosphoryl diester phosphodiesterase